MLSYLGFFKKNRGNWVLNLPPACQIKVNVDVSFFTGSGGWVIGVVLRDSNGKVLQFSKEVRIDLAVHVELQVVQE